MDRLKAQRYGTAPYQIIVVSNWALALFLFGCIHTGLFSVTRSTHVHGRLLLLLLISYHIVLPVCSAADKCKGFEPCQPLCKLKLGAEDCGQKLIDQCSGNLTLSELGFGNWSQEQMDDAILDELAICDGCLAELFILDVESKPVHCAKHCGAMTNGSASNGAWVPWTLLTTETLGKTEYMQADSCVFFDTTAVSRGDKVYQLSEVGWSHGRCSREQNSKGRVSDFLQDGLLDLKANRNEDGLFEYEYTTVVEYEANHISANHNEYGYNACDQRALCECGYRAVITIRVRTYDWGWVG